MTKKITKLFNQTSFYPAFIKDTLNAEREVIIYSPFITKFRVEFFEKNFRGLKRRNIKIFIFTRPIAEHEQRARTEVSKTMEEYRKLGAQVFCLEGFIHEKIAIIDRKVLWEGSLNILSQRNSKEIMNRIEDRDLATQLLKHLGLTSKLKIGHGDTEPGSPISKLEKTVLDIIIPVIHWWLSALFKVIMLILKGVLAIFSVVRIILG